MTNAQNDVAASIQALSAASESGINPPSPEHDTAPSPPPPAPPGDAPVATDPTQPPPPRRGPDGRFAAADEGAPDPAAPATPDAPPAATVEPPPNEPSSPASVQLDPSKPPQGWRPEVREKWSSIPEDIRKEIIRREEASAAGVSKLRQQYEPAESLYRDLSQYNEYFQHIGRQPAEYLNEVIRMEQSLALGNPAQKFETMLAIADQYGVPIRQALDSAMGGKLGQFIQNAHQQHKTPPTIPPEVQRELHEARQFRQKIMDDAAAAEYEAFVSDKESYPFFEEVREQMADLLERNAADTYKEAYELAVYRNPEIRARELARQNGLAQKDAMLRRQQAAAGVAPPSNTPAIMGAPADPSKAVTVEDSVRAAVSQLVN